MQRPVSDERAATRRRPRRRLRRARVAIRARIERALRYERYPWAEYCDRYRCVFVHIPKNAGTSIVTLLSGDEGIPQRHNTFWDYRWADPKRFRAYTKFCVVRDPWTRLRSAYRYLAAGGNRGSDRRLAAWIEESCASFEDFVRWLDPDKIYNVRVLNPQFMYVYDMHDDRVMVDRILRYESLDEEFRAFQKTIGLKGELPWKNRSEGSEALPGYSEEMIEVVTRLYARDFEMFGYDARPAAGAASGAGSA